MPLFEECSERELALISRLSCRATPMPGATLSREGEWSRQFVIILDGQASVYRGERKVDALGPGDYFGELALIDEGPPTATVTVVADTPMRLEVMNRREFRQLLTDVPSISGQFLRANP